MQIQRQSSQFMLILKQDKCPGNFSKILQKKEEKHLKTLGWRNGGLQKPGDQLREGKVSKRIQHVSHQIQEGCMAVKFLRKRQTGNCCSGKCVPRDQRFESGKKALATSLSRRRERVDDLQGERPPVPAPTRTRHRWRPPAAHEPRLRQTNVQK